MQNVIKVRIMENIYGILSDEDEEYVNRIAHAVDHKVRGILEDNARASTTMATILACFDFCDEAAKANESAENLRGQIRNYLDEIATVRADYDKARSAIVRLEAENKRLYDELELLTAPDIKPEELNK